MLTALGAFVCWWGAELVATASIDTDGMRGKVGWGLIVVAGLLLAGATAMLFASRRRRT